MLKLLIADPSDGFTDALEDIFKNDFHIKVCHDGESALELLLSFQPDALVLNYQLPYKDSFTLLQESVWRPPIILGITPSASDYVINRSVELGVQFLLFSPTIQTVRVRLLDLIASVGKPKMTLADQTVFHLHTLNFQTHLDGYQQLCVGIPLFAQSPGMRLSKELYPAIAQKFGASDARTVEHSIRKSIEAAWRHKDPLVWLKYFPADDNGRIPCPSNKVFLSRLAEMLIPEE